jgi:hypothetical protein
VLCSAICGASIESKSIGYLFSNTARYFGQSRAGKLHGSKWCYAWCCYVLTHECGEYWNRSGLSRPVMEVLARMVEDGGVTANLKVACCLNLSQHFPTFWWKKSHRRVEGVAMASRL